MLLTTICRTIGNAWLKDRLCQFEKMCAIFFKFILTIYTARIIFETNIHIGLLFYYKNYNIHSYTISVTDLITWKISALMNTSALNKPKWKTYFVSTKTPLGTMPSAASCINFRPSNLFEKQKKRGNLVADKTRYKQHLLSQSVSAIEFT